MSFPILLNQTNQTSTNQYTYKFSRPLDLSQYEIALGSVSIYYSWRAITAARRNNSFQLIWPTGSTTTTYTITIPDGTYSASDLNNYIQYWCIQNNLYLVNNSTGAYYYFISIQTNPSSYAIQFNLNPVKTITGYTAATGFPTMPTTSYTPQVVITDSDTISFSSIVGFTQGTYPATQSTSLQSIISNSVPELDPVSAVIVGCNSLHNPIANNSNSLHTFTSSGVQYGGLITTSQGYGLSWCPLQGFDSQIVVGFYDQNYQPLQIIDPNVCIRLLIRPRKGDAIRI